MIAEMAEELIEWSYLKTPSSGTISSTEGSSCSTKWDNFFRINFIWLRSSFVYSVASYTVFPCALQCFPGSLPRILRLCILNHTSEGSLDPYQDRDILHFHETWNRTVSASWRIFHDQKTIKVNMKLLSSPVLTAMLFRWHFQCRWRSLALT